MQTPHSKAPVEILPRNLLAVSLQCCHRATHFRKYSPKNICTESLVQFFATYPPGKDGSYRNLYIWNHRNQKDCKQLQVLVDSGYQLTFKYKALITLSLNHQHPRGAIYLTAWTLCNYSKCCKNLRYSLCTFL